MFRQLFLTFVLVAGLALATGSLPALAQDGDVYLPVVTVDGRGRGNIQSPITYTRLVVDRGPLMFTDSDYKITYASVRATGGWYNRLLLDAYGGNGGVGQIKLTAHPNQYAYATNLAEVEVRAEEIPGSRSRIYLNAQNVYAGERLYLDGGGYLQQSGAALEWCFDDVCTQIAGGD